jgi:hypothetical protein
VLRSGWFRALHVIADLAGGAGFSAGSAVIGSRAEVNFTPVSGVLVTVCIVCLTPGNFTLPVRAQGSLRIGQECLALFPAGPAVFHIGIKVNAFVVAQGSPALGACRAAPGIYADLFAPAGTTADPAVLFVGKEIHTGIAAERLAGFTGNTGRFDSGGTGVRTLARLKAPGILAIFSGWADEPAGSAVPRIGLKILTVTAA